MDGRRSQRFDNRRSQHKKPPRGSWQPTVPAWEKEFCKVIGSLEWETFLQMKKFMHLDTKVLEWNDSAGEEAFCNAKARFWAEKNGLPSDIALPDPDLYIDKIDWDAEVDADLLSDLDPMITDTEEEDNEPVVIFGDALMPKEALPPNGWGDEDENLDVAAARPITNYDGPITPTGWGDEDENLGVPAACSSAQYGDPWGNSWNGWAAAASAWPGYPHHAWRGYANAWQSYSGDARQFGDRTAWGGGWNHDGWNYANNYSNYAGPGMRDGRCGAEQGQWNDSNVPLANTGGYGSSYRTSRAQANERRNHAPRHAEGRHRPPYSGRRSALGRRSSSRECTRITVERTGYQE